LNTRYLDNAPYHSVVNHELPTSLHQKSKWQNKKKSLEFNKTLFGPRKTRAQRRNR
jgi:hypothetical protein